MLVPTGWERQRRITALWRRGRTPYVAGVSDVYEEVLALASGPEPAPSPGDWDRAQVLAHLGVNDVLLAQVTEAILAGRPASYDNAQAIDSQSLRAYAVEAGEDLPERVRAAGRRLATAAGQLSQEQRETLVPARIVGGDEVVLDRAVPWGRLLDTGATRHLPLHAEQLRALRCPGAQVERATTVTARRCRTT